MLWYLLGSPPRGESNRQARRHVFKSGPAEIRASAEGTSGGRGEHERGYPPLLRGVLVSGVRR